MSEINIVVPHVALKMLYVVKRRSFVEDGAKGNKNSGYLKIVIDIYPK